MDLSKSSNSPDFTTTRLSTQTHHGQGKGEPHRVARGRRDRGRNRGVRDIPAREPQDAAAVHARPQGASSHDPLTQATPLSLLKETLAQRGVKGLYAGVGAVIIGNAAKAGVRFTTYDQFKSMLKDEDGHLSAPRSMLAGLGAGMMEAIIAVTPSETIKWDEAVCH